ncbi:AAA family ATPase [Defluviimonas sp. WL0002]|uniref:AAA family ATPase n=1 Tax=Albidovulum marisflavi TaxID=2984159 RepID=A0ABT2ZCT6_9RHOB|nr:AAA family ATPase [Defluviimonas sp. WL0002]MCV2868878.1 AAA family ATPase [Defluviimonas sp. WL0002]
MPRPYDLPSWYDEVSSALSYSDHLVLSGNLGDVYPGPDDTREEFLELHAILWAQLKATGFGALLRYDPADGLGVLAAAEHIDAEALRRVGLPMGKGASTLADVGAMHAAVADFGAFPVALLLDHASHLATSARDDGDSFFVTIDATSRERRRAKTGTRLNPTIWLVDHPADLPDWFVLQNPSLREIQLELPNLEDRFRYARHLAGTLGWLNDVSVLDQDRLLQQFALECDGKPLLAMEAIAKIARDEGLGLAHISDAIRVFRTGSRRNPWTSPVLRKRMQNAGDILGARIKGQSHAVEKTLDILARSILGLSGAQSGAMHTRPRGALFLVGPTGVGKTELAKAVTELLFGDETLCHRFDMSEFMAENSVARLLGAPPGHLGHENGGELVNAANRRPFSVFLFDEVEKAHPRVLDVFLQILDEGRLTDARGMTAYFSEALIIFTSNIGVASGSRASNMGMNVLPSDSYTELSHKIGRAVEDHFRTELKRPELLNRIGQNIVVFDFLKGPGMAQIFEALLQKVVRRIEMMHRITVSLTPEATSSLRLLCTQDFFEGGRGIANRIETHFINPLARKMFLDGAMGDICITDVREVDGKTVLEIEDDALGDKAPAKVEPRRLVQADPPRYPQRVVPGNDRWRARFERG